MPLAVDQAVPEEVVTVSRLPLRLVYGRQPMPQMEQPQASLVQQPVVAEVVVVQPQLGQGAAEPTTVAAVVVEVLALAARVTADRVSSSSRIPQPRGRCFRPT